GSSSDGPLVVSFCAVWSRTVAHSTCNRNRRMGSMLIAPPTKACSKLPSPCRVRTNQNKGFEGTIPKGGNRFSDQTMLRQDGEAFQFNGGYPVFGAKFA